MHADDERDPLDRWLSQQAEPLPPPPGTFELITRRARRRKLRKLAVTLVSAAAVAAAVAVAVPVGLNLHLSPPPTKGANVAVGSTAPRSHTPDGSASPDKTASPSPSATHPAIAPSGQAHPVPPNFQPTSVTFVSSHTAWVIGQAGTPGTCANKDPYVCTSVARTDDAGQTWQGGPAPDTGGPSGATGVSGIRFLNDTYGWAFGPELWATDDGGDSWTQVNTGGTRVTDLEASGGRAYALFATCSTPSGVSSPAFAEDCTHYTLMTATAGSNHWVAVGGATSGLTNGGGSTSAVIDLTGSKGYLLAPDGTLYSGPIGGTWSRTGTSMCQPGFPPQANGLPGAALLALVNPDQLALVCNRISATSPPAVYTSDSGGETWTQLPAAVWSDVVSADFGTMTSLAAAPDGTLTLATTTGIYVLSDTTERWEPSNATGTGAPKGGFSYVGMTTNKQGVAVPADTSLHEIWMTTDGGATWAPATSITPGH
jgi:hypothetical protein